MSKNKLYPIAETWRKQAKRGDSNDMHLQVKNDTYGVSFQFPPGWGGDKVRHVKSGELKGRVCWTTPQEKRDIAAMHEDLNGCRTRAD